MALEGLFRKLGAATGRDRDSILRRMVALAVPRRVEDDPLWMRSGSSTSVRPPPPWNPHDDGPADGSPWTMQVVNAIMKCSGEMQNDLCGKRLVGNFLGWCDTQLVRKPGFSTTNRCWLFDENEWDVHSVVSHADNNVNLSTPHPAGDPVTAANKDGVLDGVPPSLTTRPPWSASSLQYAGRCEASASCAPSSRWARAVLVRAWTHASSRTCSVAVTVSWT